MPYLLFFFDPYNREAIGMTKFKQKSRNICGSTRGTSMQRDDTSKHFIQIKWLKILVLLLAFLSVQAQDGETVFAEYLFAELPPETTEIRSAINPVDVPFFEFPGMWFKCIAIFSSNQLGSYFLISSAFSSCFYK